MTDVFPPEKRSEIMRRIRGANTKPEVELKRLFDGLGVRYVHQAKVGRWRVDFLLPDFDLVVEYRSCFWHWHQGCRRARLPKSNQDYWIPKLRRNAERDARKDAELRALGYRVFVVRDCDKRVRLAELESLLSTRWGSAGDPPSVRGTEVRARYPAGARHTDRVRQRQAGPSPRPRRQGDKGSDKGDAQGGDEIPLGERWPEPSSLRAKLFRRLPSGPAGGGG